MAEGPGCHAHLPDGQISQVSRSQPIFSLVPRFAQIKEDQVEEMGRWQESDVKGKKKSKQLPVLVNLCSLVYKGGVKEKRPDFECD